MPATIRTTPHAAKPLTDTRLSHLAKGATACVAGHDADAGDAQTLRAMGLGLDALVTVKRIGEPCIVEVRRACDCSGGHCARIGLAKRLAERIVVRPAP